MSRKSQRIAEMIASLQGRELNANYLGYFDCFNRGLFYEAHDVLEELWLPDRRGSDGDFYKGLIQLAGAFVHLQKNRLGPSAALFRLARANLQKYPPIHGHLDIHEVLALIQRWLDQLECPGPVNNPLTPANQPMLELLRSSK